MTSTPFGLRDVKVAPIEDDGSIGTLVDLPNAQTFSFSETEEYAELRGDDRVVAKRGNGPLVEWSLESGGISLEAYVIMNGGELVITGTGATQRRRYSKKGNDARPYFFVEGQAISESGGDFHGRVYKAIADGSMEGELSDAEFWVTSAEGTGIADDNLNLYDFDENASVTAIKWPETP